MNQKMKGSEKLLFTCEKNGKRSLADFENVEEALQASGGYTPNPFYVPPRNVPVFPRIGFPEGIIDFSAVMKNIQFGQKF